MAKRKATKKSGKKITRRQALKGLTVGGVAVIVGHKLLDHVGGKLLDKGWDFATAPREQMPASGSDRVATRIQIVFTAPTDSASHSMVASATGTNSLASASMTNSSSFKVTPVPKR